MTEREPPEKPDTTQPPEQGEPPPPFDPQLDLIGDMERGQEWIVDHTAGTARRADESR